MRFVIILLLIVINAIVITVNIIDITVIITIYLKKPISLQLCIGRAKCAQKWLLSHHHHLCYVIITTFSEKTSSPCDCVEYAQEWILSEQLASSYSPRYMRKLSKEMVTMMMVVMIMMVMVMMAYKFLLSAIYEENFLRK